MKRLECFMKTKKKKGRGFLLVGILTAVAGMILAPKLRAKKIEKKTKK